MSTSTGTDTAKSERLSLSEAAELLIDECRMVLPGIQSLFGFQLIVVFSQGFQDKLDNFEQLLHLLAVALIAIAIALIMMPAAAHRQMDPCEVTRGFIGLCRRVLLLSMVPLAIALCIDFYLVARVITGSTDVAWLAIGLLAVFVLLWFVLPRALRARLRAAE